MKKKTLGRIAVFAFALCMVSTCLLSGTLAKFATNITGTGTVNVAEWTDVAFQGATKTEDFEFDLANTKETNENVDATAIAPGDIGSFTVTATAAEVAYDLTIRVNPVGNSVPVKFYADNAYEHEITVDEPLTVEVARNIAPEAQVIYWRWVSANDVTDTGTEGIGTTFTVNIEAAQQVIARP